MTLDVVGFFVIGAALLLLGVMVSVVIRRTFVAWWSRRSKIRAARVLGKFK